MRRFHSVLLTALFILATQANAEQWSFVTEDFPPFSRAAGSPLQFSDGMVGGPLVEIVQAVCDRMQLNCPVALHPWQRALHLAEAGKVDGIFAMVRSPQREREFHFTRKLVTSRYAVFTRADSDFRYNQPADLAGQLVGVYGPSGTSYVLSELLKPVTGVEMHLTASNRRLLRMLASGRFGERGVAVLNQDVAWYLIEDEQLDELREAGELMSVSYSIALSRKRVSEAQFQAFEQALDALIADGTIPEILRRHQVQPAY